MEKGVSLQNTCTCTILVHTYLHIWLLYPLLKSLYNTYIEGVGRALTMERDLKSPLHSLLIN